MRYLWDHYHLPMMITENGYGAHETKDADGQVHDQGRIDYLREHIYQLGMAIEDGCEVIAYNDSAWVHLKARECAIVSYRTFNRVFYGTCLLASKSEDNHFLGAHNGSDTYRKGLLRNLVHIILEET